MSYRSGLPAFCALFFLAGIAATTPAAELTLRDEKIAQIAEGRTQLKYLVNCALAPDDTVIADVDGRRYTFHGGMELAPAWATQPLSTQEQRLVSACILARTNYFGVPVQLSIRSDAGDVPASLSTDIDERRDYPFFEGGFFGNIFLEQPEAYVCTDDNGADRVPHLRSLLRVCSLPMTSQQSISRCGFTIAGDCGSEAYLQNGADYSTQVLKAFLPGRKQPGRQSR
ncbi:hypothetical protein EGT07_07175 [Herbaspirillum sp. HC18]|nr:hypothetical protein EGT07_07175 [Herbaspirillum sp. HC18]